MSKPMGMMSGCYFVGREELLQWINDLLDLNYTRVEDTSNGAAFCQVMDAIHPGTVALRNVNYNAVIEPDMVNNYKILQDCFDKNKITQYIDVPTLTKGKYMAALELFQWVHGYYVQNAPDEPYDAAARRRQCHCSPPNSSVSKGKPKPAGMAQRKNGGPVKASVASNEVGQIPGRVKPHPVSQHPQHSHDEDQEEKPPKHAIKSSAPTARETKAQRETHDSGASSSELIKLQKENKQLKKEKADNEAEIAQLNQERDFYYGKLRRIEDYCQDHEDEENLKQILEILYEADEAHGFLPPTEEDE